MRSSAAGLALALVLTGCGSSSNFNQIWGKESDGADTKLIDAQLAYDRGNYDEARKLANELLAVNPDHEQAAIVLGYTYLSAGGMDPFRLSRKLIDVTSTDDDATKTSGLMATATNPNTSTGTGTSGNSSATSASSTLKKLAELLNVSEADYDVLSTPYTSSSGLFSATDKASKILIPNKISDELRAHVSVLHNMNLALKAVCRFVDPAVLADVTERFGADDGCARTPNITTSASKSHVIWAFAHLTEAMVYQSVLLFSGTGATDSNFQATVNKLNTASFTGGDAGSAITQFVGQVDDLKTAIDSVFNTDADSMLTETLRDLRTVNNAFTVLGLPEQFTKKITAALSNIDSIASEIGDKANQTVQTQALKTQMTEKFASTVGKKLGDALDKQNEVVKASLAENPENAAAFEQQFPKGLNKDNVSQVPTDFFGGATEAEKQKQKDALVNNFTASCNAYDTMSKDLPKSKADASKPAACKPAAP